jgi:hypothetical protein
MPAAERIEVYVETGVAMAYESGVAAWTYDLGTWGRCGQGSDERGALADLAARIGTDPAAFVVAERIHGDEQAFDRDRVPATATERTATQAIVDRARAATLVLLKGCADELLDVDDPDRPMPPWARWRTLRSMFWHVADTDCRYYLTSAGWPGRPRAAELETELAECAAHVRAAVAGMPPDLIRRHGDQEWTTTKVLRRLAWHERSELEAMRSLAVANAALIEPDPTKRRSWNSTAS